MKTLAPLACPRSGERKRPLYIFVRGGDMTVVDTDESGAIVVATSMIRASPWSSDERRLVEDQERKVNPPRSAAGVGHKHVVDPANRSPLRRMVERARVRAGRLLVRNRAPVMAPSGSTALRQRRATASKPVTNRPSGPGPSSAKASLRRAARRLPVRRDEARKLRAHAGVMLLPFVRSLIEGATPLHLIEKPFAWSGAGFARHRRHDSGTRYAVPAS